MEIYQQVEKQYTDSVNNHCKKHKTGFGILKILPFGVHLLQYRYCFNGNAGNHFNGHSVINNSMLKQLK